MCKCKSGLMKPWREMGGNACICFHLFTDVKLGICDWCRCEGLLYSGTYVLTSTSGEKN